MENFLVHTKTKQEAIFFAKLLDKMQVSYERTLKSKTVGTKVKEIKTPNKNTIEAMEELKQGKGVRFKTVEELFKSI
ncbi:MAG: hypothetical protein LBE82_03735 [Chitinophagaceae bacterium]|jgi:antitoxin component of RelBE/YafQ-DinJ toxin-antitoxin module|nr:hypothetical protein [Chitinophagaceae bacterium]